MWEAKANLFLGEYSSRIAEEWDQDTAHHELVIGMDLTALSSSGQEVWPGCQVSQWSQQVHPPDQLSDPYKFLQQEPTR